MSYPLALRAADAVASIQTYAQANSLDDGFSTVAEGHDQAFFDTALGGVVRSFLGAGGILIVIVAILKAIKSVSSGKIGDAVKTILGAVVLAVFMFQPSMITSLISAAAGIIEVIVSSIGDLAGGGDA